MIQVERADLPSKDPRLAMTASQVSWATSSATARFLTMLSASLTKAPWCRAISSLIAFWSPLRRRLRKCSSVLNLTANAAADNQNVSPITTAPCPVPP
ncbi:hypothetical protein KGO5_03589 [Sinorhizobium sp. KGO-5]|nr:hypothetical protein KGO5_03589 [Sinorhizobium sp. KGO-5]